MASGTASEVAAFGNTQYARRGRRQKRVVGGSRRYREYAQPNLWATGFSANSSDEVKEKKPGSQCSCREEGGKQDEHNTGAPRGFGVRPYGARRSSGVFRGGGRDVLLRKYLLYAWYVPLQT